ncbi:hypothetical protein [Leuconostoc mesenteroides]|uniref:hypothetical protein n=1 Tax=Leuconostoc mesenteroides TaxID=1245 RepID=UPI000A03E3A4|nr:hypothetical protein [Leuconostoc mesenteroides]ARN64103.1 hypothetical protein A0F18_08650 [Leuconostoc mesenteroides subsp. mesenteroides]MDV8927616.1 hypothetical protein [Leuconostoc mesenteroides]ORI91387.1 hypothetical protein BMS97_01610 [Leuconostoc mesenteroides subsp. mesenteroides]ORI92300.1 hypothetical protein BMS98_05960 [Leuconostoc mesenteroides subsp. mesenteroides]
MTFDEAIAKVGTYLKNNDLSNSDNNDRFFYIILNDLRQEYAPTVEMKPYQFEVFKKYRYGVRKGDIDFGGIWSDKPYRMMQYFKEESYTGTTIWDDNFAKAWLHPETIKIVDE